MFNIYKTAAVLCVFLTHVFADMYLQHPHGSNNRLDEANRERNNGNRMFNSQNNNRGGYNVGKVVYYSGETVAIQWTNQHSAGKYQMEHTEVVIQIGCDEKIRDGTTTATIPDKPTDCYNYDCDLDVEYGRHESYYWYQLCKANERNKGLFTANQNLRNRNTAKYTRQNPQGTRRGYECDEERDYYPYWRNTGLWADLAILTADVTRCDSYKAESENVKAKGECVPNPIWWRYKMKERGSSSGMLPNTEANCTKHAQENPYTVPTGYPGAGSIIFPYSWQVKPALGLGAPDCVEIPVSRANHHGFVGGLNKMMKWEWTVPHPDTISTGKDFWTNRFTWAGQTTKQCVLRARYNITTGDYMAWDSPNTVGAGLNYKNNSWKRSPNADNDPAEVKVWEDYRLTGKSGDTWCNFVNGPNANDQEQKECRGYVFRNNPRVDPFDLKLEPTNPNSTRVQVQLAINTNQFGRTFEDRTHTFYLRQSAGSGDFEGNAMPTGANIVNAYARGKRGNIVQVYPATEYFMVDGAAVAPGDYLHFCWSGSNTNPNNNDGQGKAGTDRHNYCPINGPQFDKSMYGVVDGNDYGYTANKGDLGTSYPARFSDRPVGSEGFPRPKHANLRSVQDVGETGLSLEMWKDLCLVRQTGRDELIDAGNMEELDGNAPNQCFPPMKVGDPLNIMTGSDATLAQKVTVISTRNNNFSNRSEKGFYWITATHTATYTVSPSLGGTFQSSNNRGGIVIIDQGATSAAMTFTVSTNQRACQTEILFDPALLTGTGKIQLWIPCQPKALHSPIVNHKSTTGGSWQKHSNAQKGFRNGVYMSIVKISSPGTYKATQELDPLAISGVVFGCLFFVCAIGVGCIKSKLSSQ